MWRRFQVNMSLFLLPAVSCFVGSAALLLKFLVTDYYNFKGFFFGNVNSVLSHS